MSENGPIPPNFSVENHDQNGICSGLVLGISDFQTHSYMASQLRSTTFLAPSTGNGRPVAFFVDRRSVSPKRAAACGFLENGASRVCSSFQCKTCDSWKDDNDIKMI